MSEFFGIDMTYIMIGLLFVLFVALSSVAYVVLRNRVMFQVGVRNIPRRRAQTILIIVGLMLSTLIISTALGIGDTADYSITNTAYNQLHSVDEVVSARTEIQETDPNQSAAQQQDEETNDGLAPFVFLDSPQPIPDATADELVTQFRQIDGVDGAMKVIRGSAAVTNETKGQTEPYVAIVGAPPDITGFESDFETLSGERVSPSDLRPGEIYASKGASKELDITAGDVLTLFANGAPHPFTVKAVVEDRVLTGSALADTFGFSLGYEAARELLGRPAEADLIVVSNDGGVRDSLGNSDSVAKALNAELEGTPWSAGKSKQAFVDVAGDTASIFTTIFVVLGLFSIASGMLLIFLIFVMLAAERKVEMGMVRAIGTRRSHLVQMFMSEGMVYNVAAAAIGCLLGVLVSIGMVQVMARLFAGEGLDITFHVTLRSLIVAYSIGVVLTFLTVTFSSWRVGNLNIVSAIRDSADPVTSRQRPEGRGGIGGIIRYIAWVLFKPESWRQLFAGIGGAVAGAVLAAAGAGMFAAAIILFDSSAAGSVAAVVLAIGGGLVIAIGVVILLVGLSQIFQFGPLMLIAGPLLMLLGWNKDSAFFFGAGLSLVIIGAALFVRFLGAPARPVFTAMGLVMLVFWLLFAGGSVPGTEHLDGNIEMFFLSGVTMVIAGTFVLVYNADLMLAGLALTGGLLSSLVPSIKTAVAYPLANKFRTGMTIAMISLVMFSLVMFSTMNENFDRIFLSDDALAGYDVMVTENPGNPVDDLLGKLQDTGYPTDGIAGEDPVAVANQQISNIKQLNVENPKSDNYPTYGMSQGFIENNKLTFQARATGFGTDEELRTALASNPDYVLVDSFAFQQDFGPPGPLKGLEPTDRTFAPIPIEVADAATGQTREVQIIGVISTVASGLYTGLYMPQDSFDAVFSKPVTTLHYVRLQPGTEANNTALGIERTLLAQGVQADSLRQIVSDYTAQSRAFTYLMQGFMGIGLFVGIAAVGVIAFRTVVERRQQIGMLRAIGYTRQAVALSFLMESSFTALLGIVSGITLGLLLAYQLVHTDEFVAGGVSGFYVNWMQIVLIGGFAFVASLIMTIIPSRQASSIPIAEALRYE